MSAVIGPIAAAIVAESLTRRFGDLTAVDHLDLEVGRGEVFGLLGHNGAGKTTTVRLLNGVLEPDAGRVRVLGLSPVDRGPDVRRRVGVVTESPALDDRLTARENLAFFAELFEVPAEEVGTRIDALLEAFDLTDRADERTGAYSRGMRQRVALARALLHGPDVLYLDEPTAGLDPVAARDVLGLVERLAREEGRTVLLCTHNLVEAQRLCDRVAVMARGRAVAIGTTRELADRVGDVGTLEVQVDPGDLDRARGVLVEALPAARVTVDAGTLTAPGAAREAVPGLVRSLTAAGVSVYHVAIREPSLEDVYFALTGEAGP